MSKLAVQLPLDLGHQAALAPEDFLPSPANEAALGWLARWPDWPAAGLALVGPQGAGKTHLVSIFAAHTGAVVLPAAALTVDDPPHLIRSAAIAVEDADRGVDEVALFHLFNAAREAGRKLLLTAAAPPSRWGLKLPDLSSRLATLPVVEIASPDEGLIAALLVKLFADRQLRIGQDVVAYALPRMERSFAAVRDLVARADERALAERRPVTVRLMREILEGLSDDRQESLPL